MSLSQYELIYGYVSGGLYSLHAYWVCLPFQSGFSAVDGLRDAHSHGLCVMYKLVWSTAELSLWIHFTMFIEQLSALKYCWFVTESGECLHIPLWIPCATHLWFIAVLIFYLDPVSIIFHLLKLSQNKM